MSGWLLLAVVIACAGIAVGASLALCGVISAVLSLRSRPVGEEAEPKNLPGEENSQP